MHLAWRSDLVQAGHIVLDGDPAPLPKKGAEPSSPIFCSFLLWSNGWMHQDSTWYGGRPQPRRLWVRWRPSSPKRAQPPIFGPCLLWPNGCMYQDTTWYGGRPHLRDIVLDCDPAPPQLKGHSPPIFDHWPLWPNGWIDQDATWYGGKPRRRRRCVRWGRSSPLKGT